MPTYSYKCDECAHSFEKEQRITEAPERKCPSCGKFGARRMISSANFILKGGGWYADGYGSPKSGDAKSDEGGSKDSGNDSTKSTGSDSKSTGSDTSSPAASKKTESSSATASSE